MGLGAEGEDAGSVVADWVVDSGLEAKVSEADTLDDSRVTGANVALVSGTGGGGGSPASCGVGVAADMLRLQVCKQNSEGKRL